MKKKTIWLINPYGTLPSESWRPYCFAIIGRKLSEAGFDVVWWTSSFSHHFKTQRSDSWRDIEVQERFTVRLVPTPGYKKNIGLGRIWRDLVFGCKVHFHGGGLPKPDLVIYSESPLNFGIGGYSVARRHGAPVVFHQMDLWPELIVDALPRAIRAIGHLLFCPVYLSRRYIYNKLDGVTALAKPYLDVPFTEAPVLRSRPNALIYNGIDVGRMRDIMSKSNPPSCLPSKSKNEVWAIFAGSLGPSYDIPVLIEAARLLKEKSIPIKIMIAGDGPFREEVEKAARLPEVFNMSYLGKLPADSLAAVYAKCDIGISAYSASSNVEMPDKIYDYTAAGLAVINSLVGEVSEVVLSNEIGFQYCAGAVVELVEYLMRLYASPSLLASMKRSSRELGTKYDQNVQYEKIVMLASKLT
jgi:glycosyltransferase involved in cell wall biosynthesis